MTCVVEGQYVIYYNERLGKRRIREDFSENAFNDLCEVEVYGKFYFYLEMDLLSIVFQNKIKHNFMST